MSHHLCQVTCEADATVIGELMALDGGTYGGVAAAA